MPDDQFTAIYAYEDVRIRARAPVPVTMYQLTFFQGEFEHEAVQEIGDQDLDLALTPGVYGWFGPAPVSIAIDGHVIVMTMRKRGKDPWPPPPPPPPTPNFAADELAQRLWALHWVGRNGEAFLSGLEG